MRRALLGPALYSALVLLAAFASRGREAAPPPRDPSPSAPLAGEPLPPSPAARPAGHAAPAAMPAPAAVAARGDVRRAVDGALRWLADHQAADGRWEANAGITGLVVAAFLRSGNTHKHGAYRQTVKEGLRALKQGQAADGRFARGAEDHALATHAMSGAYLLTGSPLFKTSAGQGLERLGDGPVPDDASGYLRLLAEVSVRGTWLLGPDRGGPDPREWLDRVEGRVLPAQRGPGTARGQRAAALALRLLLGDAPKSPRVAAGIRDLLLSARDAGRSLDPWELYFGTEAAFAAGRGAFDLWAAEVRPAILATLEPAGKDAGSFAPGSPGARALGRTGTTALLALSLTLDRRE